ncbi:MAG: ABC transporter ATP-binding protein [Burkholderiales bacterium]|nr:ABC transporter ATP-binding protein [Burkholderiales bacterium]
MSERVALKVDGITVRFGGVTALEAVGFAVREGETVGLIGPNGAGKTTLLNVISRLISPSSGRVELFGDDVTRAPAYSLPRRGVARTFQVVQPFANLTVRQNVAVAAMFSGSGRSEDDAAEAADRAIERTRLTAKAHMLPAHITLADRKRLELARALAMQPQVLLLDEVMAGLNHVEIDRIIDLIRDIKAQGTTIVVVEHVMKVIAAISDRIVVLQFGKKIADDSPDRVFDDPSVVSAYLGERFSKRRAAAAQGTAS